MLEPLGGHLPGDFPPRATGQAGPGQDKHPNFHCVFRGVSTLSGRHELILQIPGVTSCLFLVLCCALLLSCRAGHTERQLRPLVLTTGLWWLTRGIPVLALACDLEAGVSAL